MQLKNTIEARRELNLTERQMYYLLTSRPELEPGRIGVFRVWTASDIARVRDSLAARPIGKRRPVAK